MLYSLYKQYHIKNWLNPTVFFCSAFRALLYICTSLHLKCDICFMCNVCTALAPHFLRAPCAPPSPYFIFPPFLGDFLNLKKKLIKAATPQRIFMSRKSQNCFFIMTSEPTSSLRRIVSL